MANTITGSRRGVEAPCRETAVRRVPILDLSPECAFQMAAQYFMQAANIVTLAKEAGEKVTVEEALEAAAVQLSCQLELNPECMCRVKTALRGAEKALECQ